MIQGSSFINGNVRMTELKHRVDALCPLLSLLGLAVLPPLVSSVGRPAARLAGRLTFANWEV